MGTPLKDKNQYKLIEIPESIGVSPGKNLTGNPRVARDLIADIHNNIRKWNNFHLEGLMIVKEIIKIKENETFPEDLKEPCLKLEKICSEFDDIVCNFENITRKLKVISSLHHDNEKLFITWPIEKFGLTSKTIYEAYKSEAKVKRIILENVAHYHKYSWKILHLTTWLYETQIPNNLSLKLEAMLTESKLR